MKTKNQLFFLFLTLFPFLTQAQETYVFESGLAIPSVHRYGREATFSDQLAFQLNNGTLKTPVAGQVLFTDKKDNPPKWEEINADAEKKFRGRSLANGYLYLTYHADKEQNALLEMTNNNMVYVNGQPRVGDLYGAGSVQLPVALKKGLNEFYVRGGRFSVWGGITAQLHFQENPVIIQTHDLTMPIAVIGGENTGLRGAVVIINNSGKPLKNLQIKSLIAGKSILTEIPEIPAVSIRKVGFRMDASGLDSKGKFSCELSLIQEKNQLDKKEIQLETALPGEDYSETFISEIDGSTQYYSVSPQTQGGSNPPALFLSVHGAGVEAINQARAYGSKEAGVIVCPTNRRPRGFNWEDWGCMDAMEVLNIAKNKFKPDPERIYLTGHSMGGHGTWFLGATFAGSWAAIAPCAGYPTMSTYGSADGLIPAPGKSGMEDLLLQASNPGNTFELIRNYNAGGVYIFHGDSDRVVSVEYARDMRKRLSEQTKDLSYYEYPGGSHWFGDESVDWKPIFNYFSWHTIPKDTIVKEIHFTTANPAVSSKHYWTEILQQDASLKYSRLILKRSNDLKTITGTTENVSLLAFSLEGLNPGDTLSVGLDNIPPVQYTVSVQQPKLYLRKGIKGWVVADSGNPKEKGIIRNGTFKEPFSHRMVFVYGTSGTKEENNWAFGKARYDAECWYYRGNGAVDIVPDVKFTPADYPDRGVILYGNAVTNKAWKSLLSDCPVQVTRTAVAVGTEKYEGDNLAAYFMWPRPDSETAGVAVICGTGIEGMKAADANQYFSGGSGFPDYMLFSSDLLIKGVEGIKTAGFYGNDWRVESGQNQ